MLGALDRLAVALEFGYDAGNNAIFDRSEMRALCNGKTLAFQARDTGSIPVARSKKSQEHTTDRVILRV